MSSPAVLDKSTFRYDFTASIVVFLVALPLCVGVAVASGVPAELGLITGIVGGLVAGALPGSQLQVSGPAAGLTVLVFEAVQDHGLGALGALVLMTGGLQVLLGALKLGNWFRAISLSVVEGMLAGIGLVLMASQLYSMADVSAPSGGLAKLAGLPGLLPDIFGSTHALTAFALGAGTILVMVVWKRLPGLAKVMPAPLAGVALATLVTLILGLNVKTVEVQGLFDSIQLPSLSDFTGLAEVGTIGTVLAFTLIASAESLFSAAAVDRMHDGPRTHFDKELMSQGAGNAVSGLLGALPMTAVIVRSAANVQAGARTKASRIMHGAWLLLFAALLPFVLKLIPIAALAGVLVNSGFKLVPFRELGRMWRDHRGEAVILAVTATAIVTVSMFEGVIIGLLLSVLKTAWDTSHVHLEVEDSGSGPILVHIIGNATFLRLPKMIDALEDLPKDRPITLDLDRLRHLDHACRAALNNWAARHNDEGTDPVHVPDHPLVDA